MRALQFGEGVLSTGPRAALVGETLDVGRERDNHVVIVHPSVSRHHARIEWREGAYVVVDRGSRNGVWVNGARVAASRIAPGDVVGFGEVRALYEDDEHETLPASAPSAPADALDIEQVRAGLGDRYHVEDVLGEGAQSRVFRALRLRDGITVALKVLRGILDRGSPEEARFQREARALIRLRHPAIVSLHEAGRLGPRPYLAIEHLGGGSIEDGLRATGRLTPEAVASVGARLCDALDHAHEAGVLHRDVKPSNVLRDAGGHAVLADFGMVKLLEETSLTDRGAALGTPAYMAPELFAGERATIQSDLWSLGATLYRCLTGQPPFPGRTLPEIAQRVTSPRVSPLPIASHRQDVPGALADAVLACLSKDPAHRPSSARELRARLLRG